ncbi:MAG: HD domain-containing protein [Bacteroidota bacterium]
MDYPAAKAYILRQLENNLSDLLYYHGVHHTLDVLKRTDELCHDEKIPPYETTLLKTAALYHDCGFMFNSKDHERLGCDLARKALPAFRYKDQAIERICGMIMATKVPQNPQTDLEAILCDADLDYLGRDDFPTIGDTLFQELQAHQILQNREEWNKMQVAFLERHAYFTKTNQQLRQPRKQEHLDQLKTIVMGYEKNG